MKLTILAATGGIGSHLLQQARDAGHDVTAVARTPAKLPTGVRAVQADLSQATATDLAEAVEGADAVLSGLGATSTAEAGVAEHGTRAITQAMTRAGVGRLVVVSAAPVGTVASPDRPRPPRHDPGDGIVMRTVLSPVIKRVLRHAYADLARMEDVLRRGDRQWTAVRPPQLTDQPLSGHYRTALDRNLRGGLKIGRADTAHLMLALLERPHTIGHTVGIAY